MCVCMFYQTLVPFQPLIRTTFMMNDGSSDMSSMSTTTTTTTTSSSSGTLCESHKDCDLINYGCDSRSNSTSSSSGSSAVSVVSDNYHRNALTFEEYEQLRQSFIQEVFIPCIGQSIHNASTRLDFLKKLYAEVRYRYIRLISFIGKLGILVAIITSVQQLVVLFIDNLGQNSKNNYANIILSFILGIIVVTLGVFINKFNENIKQLSEASSNISNSIYHFQGYIDDYANMDLDSVSQRKGYEIMKTMNDRYIDITKHAQLMLEQHEPLFTVRHFFHPSKKPIAQRSRVVNINNNDLVNVSVVDHCTNHRHVHPHRQVYATDANEQFTITNRWNNLIP